jgi:hypothetical protein
MEKLQEQLKKLQQHQSKLPNEDFNLLRAGLEETILSVIALDERIKKIARGNRRAAVRAGSPNQ